jgi:hypothetical protein
MVKKIKYNNLLPSKWNIVTVTNDIGQEWELRRNGISAENVKKFIKETDKTEGIKTLIAEGKLIPIYGGDLNL